MLEQGVSCDGYGDGLLPIQTTAGVWHNPTSPTPPLVVVNQIPFCKKCSANFLCKRWREHFVSCDGDWYLLVRGNHLPQQGIPTHAGLVAKSQSRDGRGWTIEELHFWGQYLYHLYTWTHLYYLCNVESVYSLCYGRVQCNAMEGSVGLLKKRRRKKVKNLP